MESYQTEIANNPAIELIHVSLDHDPGEAEKWAGEAHLPWPVLLRKDTPAEVMAYFVSGGVPDYILVNSAGDVVANGKEAAFLKIRRHSSK